MFHDLNLFSSYWQVKMANNLMEMTPLVTRIGTYEFEGMPFELMNAPPIYQTIMDCDTRDIPFV